MSLISWLWRAPFWVQFGLAMIFAWMAYSTQTTIARNHLILADLARSAPPATIPVASFKSDKPAGMPVEVSVLAQIALDHTTRLVRKSNFVTTDEAVLYVLLDPDATKETKVARAAMVIDSRDVDRQAEILAANTVGNGEDGPLVIVDGLRSSGTLTSMVKEALEEQGLSRAEGFFFIDPFLKGREESLMTVSDKDRIAVPGLWGLAAFFSLLGSYRLLRKLAKTRDSPRLRPDPPAGVPTASRAQAVPAGPSEAARAVVPPRTGLQTRHLVLAAFGMIILASVTQRYEFLVILPFLFVMLALHLGLRGLGFVWGAVTDRAASRPAATAPATVRPGESRTPLRGPAIQTTLTFRERLETLPGKVVMVAAGIGIYLLLALYSPSGVRNTPGPDTQPVSAPGATVAVPASGAPAIAGAGKDATQEGRFLTLPALSAALGLLAALAIASRARRRMQGRNFFGASRVSPDPFDRLAESRRTGKQRPERE